MTTTKNRFELVSGTTFSFKNDQDKESYGELKEYLTGFHDKEIEQWFIKNNLNTQEYQNLAQAIGQHTFYFSVSTVTATTKQEIIETQNKLYELLLKNFSFDNQLKILVQQYDLNENNLRIFKILYETAKEENQLNKFYTSRVLLDPLFKLFSDEKFIALSEFEKTINKPIRELVSHYMTFRRTNPNNTGTSYYKLSNEYFLTDEIILNYSDNKLNYLTENNIELPTKVKAEQLLKDIEEDYNGRSWRSVSDELTLEDVKNAIDNYIKVTLYYQLGDNLSNESNSRSRFKV